METDLLNLIIKNVRNIRATNCLVDFVYVADGRLGGYINHASKIWDIAAPYLIIKEAGGIMTDILGNEIIFDLSINNYLRNYQIIASGKNCFDKVLSLTEQVYG
jgi:myo-inositol-1(or 4)-monophosphatase